MYMALPLPSNTSPLQNTPSDFHFFMMMMVMIIVVVVDFLFVFFYNLLSCHKMASNLNCFWFVWSTECGSLNVLQVHPADGTKLPSDSALGSRKSRHVSGKCQSSQKTQSESGFSRLTVWIQTEQSQTSMRSPFTNFPLIFLPLSF